MALLDLGKVTKTLLRVIEEEFKLMSSVWPPAPGTVLEASPMPPDKLSGENAVGLYLYHVAEDPELKNAVWQGRPKTPLRFTPMALRLHYVLTTHSDLEGSTGPLREQLMMGIAMKALRDYPVVDDATRVNGVSVLEPGLMGAGNRIRISLQPVKHTEAVTYWTAGSSPLRLSSYYEMAVVLLEPDEPTTGGGRVLAYGINTLLGGAPRLEASRGRLSFRIPGETVDRTLELQPAQAAAGDEVTFHGTDLAGDAVTLLIRHATWPAPREVDAAWGGVFTPERAFVTVQSTIDGVPVPPGTYEAMVRSTKRLELPGGGTRNLDRLSNAVPFVVTPGILPGAAGVGTPDASGLFTITGSGYTPTTEVRAYIGDAQLTPGTPGALGPGQFAVMGPTSVELRIPASVPSGSTVAVRLIVNGAESPPRWVVAP
jgi:hypothetical protein